jgi:phospholipid/cholesterol/gamma-HCH transport system substrate-binding protein
VNPTNHWKLGAFVLATLLLAITVLGFLGAERLNREVFETVSYFSESVEGLEVGSPVKFRGVTLGRVNNITFAPNRREVQVTAQIDFATVERLGLLESLPLERQGLQFEIEGLRVQLSRSGITGIAFLEADVFDPLQHPLPSYDFALPWNYLPTVPSTLKSLEGRLSESLDALPGVLRSADLLLQRLEGVLAAARVAELSASVSGSLDSARGLVDELRAADPTGLVQDTRDTMTAITTLAGELSAEMATVRAVLARLESGVGTLESELGSADLSDTVAALRRAAESVAELARDGTATSADLRRELRGAGETLDALRALAELLERDPSALLKGRP